MLIDIHCCLSCLLQVYDVKELHMLVHFVEMYPKEILKISLSDDQQLPDTVRR